MSGVVTLGEVNEPAGECFIKFRDWCKRHYDSVLGCCVK